MWGNLFIGRISKTTPHNSASRFDERFFVKARLKRRRNAVCISNFSNRKIGEKDSPKREYAIVRYCLAVLACTKWKTLNHQYKWLSVL